MTNVMDAEIGDVMATGDPRPPRERMVYSAAQLIRQRGVTGTGIRDVVAAAAAPRGSFQHYFPGGKDQLVTEALGWSAAYAAAWVGEYLPSARRPSPSGLFEHLAAPWIQEFTRRGFERGCPVMATAADVAAEDNPLTDPLLEALGQWEQAIVATLVELKVPLRRARRLAVLMLSALEGAIMMARVQRSTKPLTTVVGELGPLLDDTLS